MIRRRPYPTMVATAGGTRKADSLLHSFEPRRQTNPMNCKLLICVAVLTTLTCNVTPANAQEKRSHVLAKQKLAPLMQMKLDRSKAILEGLALEDFEKISKNARALRLLSLESGWNVLQTEEYSHQSLDFRHNTELIAAAGDEKDLGRATLGYVALTVRCVECHSYMRKTLDKNPADAKKGK